MCHVCRKAERHAGGRFVWGRPGNQFRLFPYMVVWLDVRRFEIQTGAPAARFTQYCCCLGGHREITTYRSLGASRSQTKRHQKYIAAFSSSPCEESQDVSGNISRTRLVNRAATDSRFTPGLLLGRRRGLRCPRSRKTGALSRRARRRHLESGQGATLSESGQGRALCERCLRCSLRTLYGRVYEVEAYPGASEDLSCQQLVDIPRAPTDCAAASLFGNNSRPAASQLDLA